MEKYQINLKLMINTQQSRPFSARTLPPITDGMRTSKEEVIAHSRANYARPREKVEEAIRRWTQKTFAPGQDKEKAKEQKREMYAK